MFFYNIFINILATPQCSGVNEIFSECDNNDCQLTCSDMDNSDCTRTCISGCICKPGFVRNGVGNCVPPTACRE